MTCQYGSGIRVWKKSSPPPSLKRYKFEKDTIWTVPDGVTSVFVSVAGGGGGGYDSGVDIHPGRIISGGAGGSVMQMPLTLTPEENVNIKVGQGGPPNRHGFASSFGNYIFCEGGYSSNTGGPQGGACGGESKRSPSGVYIQVNGDSGGNAPEPATPIGYGKGGASHRCSGCFGVYGYYDKAHGLKGDDGVVIIDALY